jgi:hypothetical protein
MANRNNELYSPVVEVAWANLRKPDEFRGSRKHDVQVVVNDEFKTQLDGFNMPLTGTYVGKESGDTIVKVKTTEFTKQDKNEYGRIVDSKGHKTDYFPQKGDKVRLKIWAREWEGKMSLFLSGVQVIEANNQSGSGWEEHEGGYIAAETSTKECCNDPETCEDTSCEKVAAGGSNIDSKDLPF